MYAINEGEFHLPNIIMVYVWHPARCIAIAAPERIDRIPIEIAGKGNYCFSPKICICWTTDLGVIWNCFPLFCFIAHIGVMSELFG